ncbi:MAG: hypothetical protein R3C10_06940 [Pirellulales bacterium]
MLESVAQSGQAVPDVDVRFAGLITVYCWRMSATDSLLQLHKQKFGLEQVANDGVESQKLLARLPADWSFPQHDDVEAFAYPPGLPGAKEGEFEFVMLHDKMSQEIYFYYYFNF